MFIPLMDQYYVVYYKMEKISNRYLQRQLCLSLSEGRVSPYLNRGSPPERIDMK